MSFGRHFHGDADPQHSPKRTFLEVSNGLETLYFMLRQT